MIAILPFLLFATIGDQEPATPDLRTMQMAQYLAGSAAADLEAAGGFGTSENVPVVLPRGELPDIGVRALLKKTKTGLSFTLANGGNTAAWFYAGDSRILAWLEAKDAKGEWKPIEYLPWYTCGNSYHRVQLPPGHGWKWSVTIPQGLVKTSVRWHYKFGKDEVVSNEVQTSIPSQRFRLDAKLREKNEIRTDWGSPTLMPKNFGR